MIIRQGKRSFLCTPISIGLPIIFLVAASVHLYIVIWAMHVDENDVVPLFCVFFLLSVFMVVFTGFKSAWRVIIQQNVIVCKGPFPRDTFFLEYDKCTIGMECHQQNGNPIWWIYLCYGRRYNYRSAKNSKSINSINCQPGFIRIMYRDEVYEALIDVLPRNQRNALISSRRCEGFKNQGRII